MLPSAHLDIEYSPLQERLLEPTPQDFAAREIVKHAHGAGAQQNLAKRKLDALGNVRGVSGFANDERRQAQLRNQLELTASLAEISKRSAEEKECRKSADVEKLLGEVPKALENYQTHSGDLMKLTKNQLRAVAFAKFGGVTLKESDAKPFLVQELSKLIAKQPTVLRLLAAPAVAHAPAAAAPAVAHAPAAAAPAVALAPAAAAPAGAHNPAAAEPAVAAPAAGLVFAHPIPSNMNVSGFGYAVATPVLSPSEYFS